MECLAQEPVLFEDVLCQVTPRGTSLLSSPLAPLRAGGCLAAGRV